MSICAGIPLRVTSPLRASVPATTPISSVRRLGSAGSVSQQSSLMTSSHQIPITRLPSRHGSVSPTAADSELEASLSVWSLSESSSLEVPLSSRAPAFIQPTSRRSPSPPPQYPTLSARGPVSSMPASLNAVHLGRSPTLTDRVLLTSPITQPKKPLPSSSTSGVRLPSLQSPSLYQPDASISSQYSTMGYNSEGFVGAGRSPIKRPVTSPEKSSPMASLPVFRKKIESPKAMVWRSSALAPVAATSPKTFSTGDIRELYRAAQLKKQ